MGAISIDIKIRGLDELRRKLGRPLSEEPEVHDGLETIRQRTHRGGRGAGARNNVINSQRLSAMSYRITSTRYHPRQRGTAWQKKQISIFKGMAPRVLGKIVRGIASRFAQ